MLSAFYMTKNIQIIIYYLRYRVKKFLNTMTYFIKKITLAKIYQFFSHIDTTAYTNTQICRYYANKTV